MPNLAVWPTIAFACATDAATTVYDATSNAVLAFGVWAVMVFIAQLDSPLLQKALSYPSLAVGIRNGSGDESTAGGLIVITGPNSAQGQIDRHL